MSEPAVEEPRPPTLVVSPPLTRDPTLVDAAWRFRQLPLASAECTSLPVASADASPGEDLTHEVSQAVRAAVLLMLTSDAEGRLSILLTERAKHLKKHAGQIALPGGKIEPGESAVDAALREAFEEVGLSQDAVLHLGVVEPYLTRTGFLVTPVVGVLRRTVELRANPSEVADVFTVPWSVLMDPAHHREAHAIFDGVNRTYFEIIHDQRRIWGVTAGILRLIHQRVLLS